MHHNVTLALVAHDRCKELLAGFALDHRASLSRFHLVATRDTGKLVERYTHLPVHLLEHGPQGGDQQISELAASNDVQAVIFFRDPISPGPHEPDFSELLAWCDRLQIPVATNGSTAEALLFFLLNSPNRGAILARPWGLEHAASEEHTGSGTER